MRSHITGVVVALLLFVGALPAAADALASNVNATRGSALPIEGTVDAAAQASAQRQANAKALGHASLAGLPCSAAGEVVGTGPNIDAIWQGFKASSPHWSLITRSGWTSMGTGIAQTAEGAVYVSIIFCTQPGAETPAPPAESTPPAPTAPAPSASGGATAPVNRAEVTAEPSRTYVEVMRLWLDAMEVIAVTEFGAMPPPIAEDDDLVASIPVVV